MPQYQGVWSLQQQMQALTSGRWVTDPLFDYTTLLLQADDAANSAQNNTFLDSSTNAFAITRNGNTTQGTFSPFAQGPGYWGNYFDGSSLLTVPANNAFVFGTGDFTIEFWIYQTAAWTTNNIINNVSSGNTSWSVEVSSGNIFLSGWNTTFLNAGTAPSINAWHHIAICRSGTTLSMFVDGVRIGTTTNSTNFSANNTLSIGGFSGFYYANGYLSNVRLVKGTAVYNPSLSTCVVPTSPLTAISGTSVLTCQNNRFIDNSNNAFVVSVGGGTPSVQAFSPFAPQFQYTASGTGGSGYFDGTGDYLLGGTSSAYTLGTGDYCIEFWMYATNTSSSTGIVGLGGAVTGVGTVFINAAGGTANVRMNAVNGTALTTANNVWAANTWNQIVITRQSGSGRIFVNGVLQAQGSFTDNLGGTDLSVGRSYYNLNQEYFTGWLSGVRIVKGSVPTTYQTSSTTVGASIFTSPTTPLTTSSQGATAANVSILLNFTNAGILDGTMKNNLETVGNAQVSTSVVKYGSGSMYFDGTDDRLVMPSSQNLVFGTGDFTIEGWFYANSVSNKGVLQLSGTAGGLQGNETNNIAFALQTGNYTLYAANAANGLTGIPPLSTWTHFAIVRASGVTRLYINGTQTGSSITDTNNYSGGNLCIGGYYATGFLYNGYLDDIRITKGIARYTQNFIPPSVALPRQ